MKPFVLLATRPEDEAADNEYEGFLRFGQLRESELIRLRLEKEEMPQFDLDKISGFIVSGSPYCASTPTVDKSADQIRVEAEFTQLLDLVYDTDFPFLGACYGVGTLGVHQGALIDSTYSEEISAPLITCTPQGETDPIMRQIPNQFHAYVGHKEGCTRLPKSAILLAQAQRCPVQMFRVKENLYATQFHPELDWDSLLLRINIYQHYGYYPPQEKERIITGCAGHDVSAANSVLAGFVDRYRR